ncbi:protein kinase domain-containing protein [Fulvivirga imtechensis]|nr:protein kinase [Fulvivirga imtechensis]
MDLYQRLKSLSKDEKPNGKKIIQDFLNTKNMDKWIVGNVDNPSGQSITCDVYYEENKLHGKLKIFNLYKNLNSRERFLREVEILEEFKNEPGIVKLLYYDKDSGIIITQKGKSFEKWWKGQKEENDIDNIYGKAVSVIHSLAYPLVRLHDAGKMHRDIKPSNIIIIDDQPQFIDFGIAFNDEDSRLTEEGEAVGNQFTSPFPIFREDEINSKWYDIFQMAQLLLWMIAEKPGKTWSRPIDYRFVKLPKDLGQDRVIKILALAGLCSDYLSCPTDGKELIKLLENLFMKKNERSDSRINLEEIKKIQQAGYASISIKNTDEMREFTCFKDLFSKICSDISDQINGVLANEDKAFIKSFSSSFNLEKFYTKIMEKLTSPAGSFACNEKSFRIICGDDPHSLIVDIQLLYYKTSTLRNYTRWDQTLCPMFLNIVRHNEHINKMRLKMGEGYLIGFNKLGELFLFDNTHPDSIHNKRSITLENISNLIMELISDKEYWKKLYKDQ